MSRDTDLFYSYIFNQAFVISADKWNVGICLITPPESEAALEAALSQNPCLTSLPSPRPSLLAPSALTLTTGTAEIFRLPEVQAAITSDFVILPCDLVCELNGSDLLEVFFTSLVKFGDYSSNDHRLSTASEPKKGGLGVWYDTRDHAEGGVGVKKEDTDFLSTTAFPVSNSPTNCTLSSPSLLSRTYEVLLAMPKDVLNDKIDEAKGVFPIRRQLLRTHGRLKTHSSHRDAHLYFFPRWVKDLIASNESFESIGEDVLGWWVKAGWQEGLAGKLNMGKALGIPERKAAATDLESPQYLQKSAWLDFANLSSTRVASFNDLQIHSDNNPQNQESQFASRVTKASHANTANPPSEPASIPRSTVPPFQGYLHPSLTKNDSSLLVNSKASNTSPAIHRDALIRRVDTVPLLISVSLYLACSNDINNTHFRPLAHPHQIHPDLSLPQQASIQTSSVLIDANVTLNPRITLRECVVGAHCSIASGSRITSCVLMDGVVIEEKVTLHGCVLGRKCKIGKGSELRDCSVQEGYFVTDGSTIKGEVIAGFDDPSANGDAGIEEKHASSQEW